MSNSIKNLFKDYYLLTKMGIVCFAILTACSGYFLSLNHFSHFSFEIFIWFLIGLYFVISGSFILNQSQEWRLDQKMNRTKNRPIACKKISPLQGFILSFCFLFFGLSLLFLLKPITAGLALLTVLLYNGFYTLSWKRYLKYGAVLGALPGALPPVIGYSLGDNPLFSTECVYLFLILFLWQMPHFWSLAIRYKEDYDRAGIPVLPVVSGHQTTLYQMGLYLLAYLGLTLISPLFLKTGLMYILFLIPFVFILAYEFHKYFYNPSHWLRFFLFVNASILIYFFVPVLDKLLFDYLLVLKTSTAGF